MKELLARLTNNYSGKMESDHLNAPRRPDSDNIQWLQKIIWIVTAIIIIAIGTYIDELSNSNHRTTERNQADNTLKVIAARLEGNIFGNLQTSKAMVSAIHSNPGLDQDQFAQFAKPLFDGSAQLRNITATRNLTLQYMYPVEGNEAAIGFDYHNRPDQLKDLLRARQTQQTIISGPFELIQGGQGLILRLPVVFPDSRQATPQVWGTISAVVDLQSLYKASGLVASNSDLNIAIRKINGDTSAAFFGNSSSFYAESQPVISEIAMPSGDQWELAAIPKNGWSPLAENAYTLRVYLILAGLIIYSMIIVTFQQINRSHRNNLLLRSLFDLSPNGIALSEFKDGKFLQVNDTLLDSTGYSRDEFIALNGWQLSARSKDEAEQYQIRALQKTGRYGPYERNYIRKDGSEFPVRLSGVLIHDDVGRSFVWSIIEDISAQKKTAEIMLRQRSLMRSMGAQARVGAWEYIVDADKIYCSEMTRKIFKVSDDFSPTHKNIKDFPYSRDSHLRITNAIGEAIKDGIPFSEEIKIRTARGCDTWIHITGQAEFHNNSCKRIYGSVQDIGIHKKVRDELVEAKENAEAAAHAKSEFLAVMSHEIRTPMNGVLGMLNLLENSPLDTDQGRKVNIAKTSAQSLLSLINDILDFSKVDAGKLELENNTFNIRKLFDDIAASHALHANEKGLELIVDQSAIEQSWVSGDSARLRQIVTNLLGNAIKFTAKGNVILRAAVQPRNGKLILSCAITDTGIGIPNSEIKRLFSPFSQVDASITRKFGGSGLGLSICKNLCELMEGSISVASKYREGSTFTFSVCLQSSSGREHRDQALIKARNRQVFIVDDNSEFKTSIAKQLRQWGAHINPAVNATALLKTSVALSPSNRADLVIIGTDSESLNEAMVLCTQLRQHPIFEKSAIVIVGNFEITDVEKIKSTGANAYYLKPVSYADLVTIINIQPHETRFPIIANTGQGLSPPNNSKQASPANAHCNNLKHEELSQHRVLLVEDNLINQEVGRCTLDEIGLTTDIAENGKLALEMLKNATPDYYSLILLDCQMPEMDGYQVCKLIRNGAAGDSYRAIPVVALTANAMSGDKEKCMSAGMNDYLPKPFTPEALIEKLKHWLPILSASLTSITAPSTISSQSASDSDDELPIWVCEKALDSAMGKPALLNKLLHLFCEQIDVHISDLDRAYAEPNFDELASIAHSVKGSAGQLHGTQLHQCAGKLERAGKTCELDTITPLYKKFKLHSQALKLCFENHLTEDQSKASKAEVV
jgi:two-component system sensor histidine kinase/response regulator